MKQLSDYLYHEEPAGKIYLGDCLEILPLIKDYDAVITDPVWPNAINLFNVNDPFILLADALNYTLGKTQRVVIHLGLDSDPRFLNSVPRQYPYIRQFALRYARPHYKGRILYDRDIAYLFGNPPASRQGNHVLPGGCIDGDTITSDNSGRLPGHPCARKLDHLLYLVSRCTNKNELILDPFLGSGTTAVAAKQIGRKFIGIEISEKYCAIAKQRLAQEELF